MSAVHFQHLRNTRNIGDLSCSPFDYFDWGDATVSDVRDADTPAHKVGVYGGGKIFGGLSNYAGVRRDAGTTNIAWGVGTLQTFPISWRYAKARRKMDLIGSRDFGDTRYTYAPCPSCMAQQFDNPAAPQHDVVFYAHAGKTDKMKIDIPAHIPVLTNECDSFAQALSFIASGATVVSNSYHGVYWSLLMGRKALCVPFSKKFSRYRLPPHVADAQTWLREIPKAQAQPEMLGLVRDATAVFKAQVDDRIAAYG